MPLVIAHGLPKSGSTFLYQVARDAIAHRSGVSHRDAKKKFFPDFDVPNFVGRREDNIVERILERLPEDSFFVIKTHGLRLTPSISGLIRTRRIIAFTSFRDPRDTIISMLDAGVSDREKGSSREFFARLHTIDDVLRHARGQWEVAREWARSSGVLRIPYYLVATEQDFVISLLCRHIGLTRSIAPLQHAYRKGKSGKIEEFHKGIADRFLSDISVPEIKRLTEAFADQIDEIDSFTRGAMAEYGFRILSMRMIAARNNQLRRLGV